MTSAEVAREKTRSHLIKDLAELRDLPTVSPVVAELTATLDREDVGLARVETIIQRDPVLAARIIRAANAAAFATHAPAVSIRSALLKLGLARVRRLALLVSFYGVMPAPPSLHKRFWCHSVAVASAAEAIRIEIGRPRQQMASDAVFLGGLLHDIGILLLGSHHARQYAPVGLHASETGVPLWEAERAVLGIDHAELGAALVERWTLPAAVVDVIRFHHDPAGAPPDTMLAAAVVSLAELLCAAEPEWDLGEAGLDGDEALAGPVAAAAALLEVDMDVQVPALGDLARSEARRAVGVIGAID